MYPMVPFRDRGQVPRRAAGFISAALLFPAGVFAAPCSNLPNPVYVSCGSVSEPILHQMAGPLAGAAAPDNMTVIYVFTQTCDTMTRLVGGTTLTGTGRYYPTPTTNANCDIPVGTLADVGVGNLFSETCREVSPTLDVSGLRQAPTMVSPAVFVVPNASPQTAISAEEAYFVYGFGMVAEVSPWLDDTLIFRRTLTAGTQFVVGASINVPVAAFRGTDGLSTQALLNSVATSATPAATIGFVSAAEADAQRATVRSLAFRAYGQNHFYWPNSRHTAFDRRNVRDGHYQMWGYEHAYLPAGAVAGGRGERFFQYITGATPLPSGDIIDVAISQGFVPICAMDVERTADDDGTSIRATTTPAACSCYYDAHAPMGSTSCATCMTSTDCGGAGVCHRGYCEVR